VIISVDVGGENDRTYLKLTASQISMNLSENSNEKSLQEINVNIDTHHFQKIVLCNHYYLRLNETSMDLRNDTSELPPRSLSL
jgi:hypothetical protein